jgi:DHA1 family multidrug resistance protein-like MFS transporter
LLHQHLAPELIGPLTSVNAIVVMIAVTIIGKRAEQRGTIGRFDVLALGALVLGGGWLLCALTGLAPIIAAVIVTSIGESLFCGVVDAMAAQLAPAGSVGLYLGYSAMAWGVGGAIGGIIGGGFGLAAQHNELIVFWLLLALIGVASAVGTRLARPYITTAIEERTAAAEAAKVAAE